MFVNVGPSSIPTPTQLKGNAPVTQSPCPVSDTAVFLEETAALHQHGCAPPPDFSSFNGSLTTGDGAVPDRPSPPTSGPSDSEPEAGLQKSPSVSEEGLEPHWTLGHHEGLFPSCISHASGLDESAARLNTQVGQMAMLPWFGPNWWSGPFEEQPTDEYGMPDGQMLPLPGHGLNHPGHQVLPGLDAQTENLSPYMPDRPGDRYPSTSSHNWTALPYQQQQFIQPSSSSPVSESDEQQLGSLGLVSRLGNPAVFQAGVDLQAETLHPEAPQDVQTGILRKRHYCQLDGCGKSFSRSSHLQVNSIPPSARLLYFYEF